MKLAVVGFLAVGMIGVAPQTGAGQAPADLVKIRGCLRGNGSNENPWVMRGVVMPPPSGVVPAAAPPAGARGDGGGRGGAGGAGAGGRGGRGGDGGRGAAPAAPAKPPVTLRLIGVDMTPWRNMFIEVRGTLGPAPSSANALREFNVETARSAYGDCN